MGRTISGAFQSQAGLGRAFVVCSRNLREIGERCRGLRAACANGKKIVGCFAQPAQTRKMLSRVSRNLRE